MMDHEYPFLADGQTESSLSLWQERLGEAPMAVLSVCLSAEKRLRQTETELIAKARASAKDALEHSGQILCSVRALARRLPSGGGFFASAEESRTAFWETCHLLTALEELLQRPHALAFLSLSLREQIGKALLDADREECALRQIRHAARESRLDDVTTGCERALAQVESLHRTASHLLPACETLFRLLGEETEEYLRAFCREASLAADLEQAGRSASPVRLLQCCNELSRAIEGTLTRANEILDRLEEQ